MAWSQAAMAASPLCLRQSRLASARAAVPPSSRASPRTKNRCIDPPMQYHPEAGRTGVATVSYWQSGAGFGLNDFLKLWSAGQGGAAAKSRDTGVHMGRLPIAFESPSRVLANAARRYFVKIMQGRSGRRSSLWSTPPRSPLRTSPASPCTRRLLRRREVASASRRSDRRGCRST